MTAITQREASPSNDGIGSNPDLREAIMRPDENAQRHGNRQKESQINVHAVERSKEVDALVELRRQVAVRYQEVETQATWVVTQRCPFEVISKGHRRKAKPLGISFLVEASLCRQVDHVETKP